MEKTSSRPSYRGSSCLWCSRPDFMSAHLLQFFSYKPGKSPSKETVAPEWCEQAYNDLLTCDDCVQVYHRQQSSISSSPHHSGQDLKKTFYLKTVYRLHDHLLAWLRVKEPSASTCLTSLREILSFPRLLLDEKLCRVFVSCLTKFDEMGCTAVDERLPGTYLLLVHPDKHVSAWATGLVKTLGLLDWTGYEEIAEVIDWLMTVVLFNLFTECPLSAGKAAWTKTEKVMLPKHLVTYDSPKHFWVGLCMLLAAMDPICISSQLLSSTSNYKQFVSIVLGGFDEGNEVIFWPLLQILSTLLERLGSKFWQLTQNSPKEAVKKILCHASFKTGLQEWALRKRQEDKGEVTHSQVVYQWRNQSDFAILENHGSETESCSPHLAIFSWIAPLIYSLIDFGSAMEDTISLVMNAVCCITSTSLQPNPVFKPSCLMGWVDPPKLKLSTDELVKVLSNQNLTNKALGILAQLIELLVNEGVFTVLLTGIMKWLPIITVVCRYIIANPLKIEHRSRHQNSVLAVRKMVHTIFNNPIGRTCPSYQLIMSHFSSKRRGPPLKSSLRVEVLQEGIVSVLKKKQASKDTCAISSSSDVKKEERTYVLIEEASSSLVNGTATIEELEMSVESTTLAEEPSPESSPLAKSSTMEESSLLAESSTMEELAESSTVELSSLAGSSPVEQRQLAGSSAVELSSLAGSTVKQSPLAGSSTVELSSLAGSSTVKLSPLVGSSTVEQSPLAGSSTVEQSPLAGSSTVELSSLAGSPTVELSSLAESSTAGMRSPSLPALSTLSKEPEKSMSLATTSNLVNEPKLSHPAVEGPPILCSVEKSLLFGEPQVVQKSDFDSTVHTIVVDSDDDSDVQIIAVVKRTQCSSSDSSLPSYLDSINSPVKKERKFKKKKSSTSSRSSNSDDKEVKKNAGHAPTLSKVTIKKEHNHSNDQVLSGCHQSSCTSKHHFLQSPYISDEDEQSFPDSTRCSNINDFSSLNEFSLAISTNNSIPSVPVKNDDISCNNEAMQCSDNLSGHEEEDDCIFDMSTCMSDVSENDDQSSSPDVNAIMLAAMESSKDPICAPHQSMQLKEETCSHDCSGDADVGETLTPTRSKKNRPSLKLKRKFEDSFQQSSSDDDFSKMVSSKRRKLNSDDDQSGQTLPKSLNSFSLNIPSCAVESRGQSTLAVSTALEAPSMPPVSASVPPSMASPSPPMSPVPLYNQNYPMPTCVVNVYRHLVTCLPKRVTPCRVKVNRLSSHSIRNLQKKPVVARQLRYKLECQRFLESQGVLVRKPLIVSIPFSYGVIVKPNVTEAGYNLDSDIDSNPTDLNSNSTDLNSMVTDGEHENDEVFTNSQIDIGREGFVVKSGGTAITVGSHNNTVAMQSSTQHPAAETRPAPQKVPIQRNAGVIHSAPFTRSRQFDVPSSSKSSTMTDSCDRHSLGIVRSNTDKHTRVTVRQNTSSATCSRAATASHSSISSDNIASFSTVMGAGHSASFNSSNNTVVRRRSVSINISPKVIRKCEDLWHHFLGWSPSFLLFSDKQPLIPKADAIPDCFESYEQYVETMRPLILCELYDTVRAAVKQSVQYPSFVADVIHFTPSNKSAEIYVMQCRFVLPRESPAVDSWLTDDYLVIVDFDTADEEDTEEFSMDAQFGLVTQFRLLPKCSKGSTDQFSVELSVQLITDIKLKIEHVKLKHVLPLASFLRKWNSLINVHRSKLIKDVLSPRGGIYFCGANNSNTSQEEEKCLHGKIYDHSQFTAINSAVSMVEEQFVHPRFLLISGPPGTGKTHTLVGIIEATLRNMKSNFQSQQVSSLPNSSASRQLSPHLLICAQSYEAVNEIIVRLMKSNLIKTECEEEGDKFSLVYVAHHTRVQREPHKDILPLTLEEIVKSRVKKLEQDAPEKEGHKLKDEIIELEKEIVAVRHRKLVANESVDECSKLLERLSKAKMVSEAKLKPLNEKIRLRQSSKDELRRKILLNADIVCCTLSGCGKGILLNCFKDPLHFSCAIIDEASRCSELDSLIPLEFGLSKVVLAGDPGLLSTPVKSELAENCKFGRSLFQRMLQHFSNQRDHNPVQSLKLQYRMNPAICHFPSQHFYRGKLRTAKSVQETCVKMQKLEPFIFFNVINGLEKKDSDGFLYNREECKFVMKLIKCLIEGVVPPSQIGIITPSRGQERLLLESLHKEFQCRKIDVGAVDMFEGREKKVIILSCVSTSPGSISNGFLCDSHKLNVALTRAKQGFYVVGHGDSLKEVNKDWEAFVQYASNKKATCTVNCEAQYDSSIYKLLQPNEAAITCPTGDRSNSDNDSSDIDVVSTEKDPRLFKYRDCFSDLSSNPSGSKSSGNGALVHCSAGNSSGIIPNSHDVSIPTTSIPDTNTGCTFSNATCPTGSSIGATNCTTTTQHHPGQTDISSVTTETSTDTCNDEETYNDGIINYDHEAGCSWPDSQSVERPQLPNYHEMDYTRDFPDPGTLQQPGGKKRKEHTSTKEIILTRQVFTSGNNNPSINRQTHSNTSRQKKKRRKGIRKFLMRK